MNTKKAKAEIEEALRDLPDHRAPTYDDKKPFIAAVFKHGPPTMDMRSEDGAMYFFKTINGTRGAKITFGQGWVKAETTVGPPDSGVGPEGVARIVCLYLEAWSNQAKRGYYDD